MLLFSETNCLIMLLFSFHRSFLDQLDSSTMPCGGAMSDIKDQMKTIQFSGDMVIHNSFDLINLFIVICYL